MSKIMIMLDFRDHLSGDSSSKVMSRQQDKLIAFKCLSKSQEVISAGLGGVPMKRMINGAVSDISHALVKPAAMMAGMAGMGGMLTPGPGSELPSPGVDFVLVPGGTVLLSSGATNLLKTNSGSLQVSPTHFSL